MPIKAEILYSIHSFVQHRTSFAKKNVWFLRNDRHTRIPRNEFAIHLYFSSFHFFCGAMIEFNKTPSMESIGVRATGTCTPVQSNCVENCAHTKFRLIGFVDMWTQPTWTKSNIEIDFWDLPNSPAQTQRMRCTEAFGPFSAEPAAEHNAAIERNMFHYKETTEQKIKRIRKSCETETGKKKEKK